MKLRLFVFTMALALATTSSAEFTRRNSFRSVPDQNGNYYSCSLVEAPKTSPEIADANDQDVDGCIAMCGRRCEDSPVFCGMW